MSGRVRGRRAPSARSEHRLAALDQTSPAEREWVRRHLLEGFGGGTVVELGSWMGGMTSTIAEALAERGGNDAFHTYDAFRFLDQAAAVATRPELGYVEGSSFRALFDERTATIAHLMTVHEEQLEQVSWDSGPIAFLFNDGSKSWAAWEAVTAAFYSALQVGAIVVEQDWLDVNEPWIHLAHHRWRDHFDVIGHIPTTSSVVFRLRKPLGEVELAHARAPGWADEDDRFDPARSQADEAFAWAADLVDGPDGHDLLRCARIMLEVMYGDSTAAADLFLRAHADGVQVADLRGRVLDRVAERRLRDLDAVVPPEASDPQGSVSPPTQAPESDPPMPRPDDVDAVAALVAWAGRRTPLELSVRHGAIDVVMLPRWASAWDASWFVGLPSSSIARVLADRSGLALDVDATVLTPAVTVASVSAAGGREVAQAVTLSGDRGERVFLAVRPELADRVVAGPSGMPPADATAASTGSEPGPDGSEGHRGRTAP